MNPYYKLDFSKGQIVATLQVIHDCVSKNRYIISKGSNRQQNEDFIRHYNLTSTKQKRILLNIAPEDFCHALQNTNLGFEHEVLYVFCPQVVLSNLDDNEETVDVYTKFNIIDYSEEKRVVVISFHKRNKPICYLFR
ncbi:MAG TPA: hypothetical protein GX016_05880 [Firmicutes bacterium]|nr:hypothetical protein [Bacillota bacterium]